MFKRIQQAGEGYWRLFLTIYFLVAGSILLYFIKNIFFDYHGNEFECVAKMSLVYLLGFTIIYWVSIRAFFWIKDGFTNSDKP